MTLNAELRSMLSSLAPGTELRNGLERILRGRTGALIVLGHDRMIESLCSGGFNLDVPFTATGLRELAKMDGAIILDSAASHIVRAGVQLVPDSSIPTEETGTRHRTADRMAKQTGVPVISVSASMHIIALYLNDHRYVLEEPAAVLGRANQALQTLARYRTRLDEVTDALSALEIEDLVTVRDIASKWWRASPTRSTPMCSNSARTAACWRSNPKSSSAGFSLNANSLFATTYLRPMKSQSKQSWPRSTSCRKRISWTCTLWPKP